jgi:hypothetical protein
MNQAHTQTSDQEYSVYEVVNEIKKTVPTALDVWATQDGFSLSCGIFLDFQIKRLRKIGLKINSICLGKNFIIVKLKGKVKRT